MEVELELGTCLGLFIETDLTDVKKYFWLCFCFNGSPISISVSSYIAVGWISIFFANDPCGCDCAVCGPIRSIPWTTLARIIWSRFGPVVKGEIRLSISKGRLRPRQYSINFSRFSNDFDDVHFYRSYTLKSWFDYNHDSWTVPDHHLESCNNHFSFSSFWNDWIRHFDFLMWWKNYQIDQNLHNDVEGTDHCLIKILQYHGESDQTHLPLKILLFRVMTGLILPDSSNKNGHVALEL